MTEADLHWIAGFFEGEGHVKKGHGANMVLVQVNPEPLVKMHALCGGRVVERKRQRPEQRPCLEWRLGGDEARALLCKLYPLMSTRRRKQMDRAIQPSRTSSVKTHCVHGHELNEENVRLSERGHRSCRECERIRDRNRRPRKVAV